MSASSDSRQARSCGESTSTPSTSKIAPRSGRSSPTRRSIGRRSLYRSGVIKDSAFPVEPWTLRECGLQLDVLAQTESLFALANGHVGLRGNLDEGEPYGIP